MNGELEVLWGGQLKPLSNNPYSESPTYMIEGNSHEKDGVGIAFGEEGVGVELHFTVNKTWLNRLKWWLFCKVFPARVKGWEKNG